MIPGAPRRILVVDDDDSGRYACSRVLRRAGYEVVEAGTGAEALRRVESDRPDLVVLDTRLPDISGTEVAGRIKSAPGTSGIPVLQMSASAVDENSRVAALDGGADGYITSPVEPAVLVATVRALLRARAAEQALAQAGRDWQVTFDSIRDGVALLDAAGVVQRCNIGLAALLDQTPPEIAGRGFDELIPPARETPGITGLLEGLRRATLERNLADRTVGITVDPMASPSGELNGGVAIVTDITERRQLERRLQHSQKLESIGLLAGGVAHDFNNLLMGILGNASLALDAQATPAKTRRALEDVVRASERAADLTRQLLAYAGKGRFVVEQVDLARLVREIVPLIQPSIPRKVQLNLEIAPGLPGVQADKGQMEQVVMNLIINAAEAMQGSPGTVTVTMGVRQVEESERSHYLTEHALTGSYLALAVRDTGVGMDQTTLNRIFDPFFSTKFLGRGLGLSATLGIVRGHSGAIRVLSSPGKGTTFEVLFPAGSALPAPAPEPTEETAVMGHGTILVIDDEETIRRLMKTVLERHGYKVLLAENGADGLTIFARNAGVISLVVLDLVMPVMSGEEVLPHLLTMRPGLPVIVSSGQDAAEGLRKLSEPRVAGYLQKPYRADALARKVADVLAATNNAAKAAGRPPSGQTS